MRRAATLAVLALAACGPAQQAQAQSYPTKPIRLIVPFPAGGTADVLARAMVQRLSEGLGQPFVVEDKPGAAGNIGSEYVARAPADGYTLLYGTIGTHGGINLALYKNLPYDPVRDFAPIALAHVLPNIMVVNLDVPAKNVAELIAWLKANPGRANFGSSGNGGISHLSGELFKTMAGVQMTHVPYKGGGAALTGMIGGQVQVMIDTSTNALSQVRAGKVRALAISTLHRSAIAPDLPPIADTVPSFEVTSWTALYAPAGTPKEIVNRLASEMAKLPKNKAYTDQLLVMGAEAPESSPEHLAGYMQAEIAKWAKLVKESGAKID
jgi:tripartite-type tricarboxylate transporter receptor subunit TctC